ncbi:sensor histidine kinase [Amycolatopsis sp. H6(2020)]|nr:sensor histidine kinase [Amycolatopsis sp. H6(2020)]
MSLTVVMLGAAAISTDQPAHPVDAVVVAAVIAVGAWVVIARRAPRTAVAGSCVCFFGALAIGVPAFSPALALGYELFGVALAGHLGWGVAVIGLVGLSSTFYRLLGEGAETFAQVAIGTLFDVALLSVILLLGETLHSRHALREEAGLRLRLAEQEHEQRVTAERLRIARDLHDVLAHTVTVIGIQANVAAENLTDRPDRAREAVEWVRAAGEDAMADLRSTIAVLRTRADSGDRPAPGIGQLADLAEAARAAGMAVTLGVRGDTTSLRPAVELTVYRLAQESLTNALRHSGGDTVTLTVDCGRDEVLVTVRDNGHGTGGACRSPGSGLRGMAERAAALGGLVQCGPADDGMPGWAVRARLPSGGV